MTLSFCQDRKSSDIPLQVSFMVTKTEVLVFGKSISRISLIWRATRSKTCCHHFLTCVQANLELFIYATEYRTSLVRRSEPIRSQSYRAGPKGRKFELGTVKEMTHDGVISASKSGWASSMVLALEQDGSPRFCLGY